MNKSEKIKKMKKIDLTIPDDLYSKEESKKTRICLMDTLMKDMDHIDRILLRKDSNAKFIPHFTIDEDGTIYQHFDEKYWNQNFYDDRNNKQTIFIAFVNLGWLQYNSATEDFENWYGIKVDRERMTERPYRSYRYWHSYTSTQLKVGAKLCLELCEEHNIKKTITETLFPKESSYTLEGIITRGNIDKSYNDLNPSFELKKFSKLLQTPKS